MTSNRREGETEFVRKLFSANHMPPDLAGATVDERVAALLSRYDSTPGQRTALGLSLVRCMEEAPDRPDSVPVLRRVLADFEDALGRTHPLHLEAAGALATALSAHGVTEEAERTYRTALWTAVGTTGEHSDLSTRLRHGLFLFLARHDRLDEALELHRKVKVTDDVALVHRGRLARLLATAGRPLDAVAEYQAALREAEAALGRDHVRTINLRTLLAVLAIDHGHPVAEEAQRGVVADLERVQGPDSPGGLVARGALARLVGRLGRPDEAAAMFRDLVHDHRRVLGPQHPGTLVTAAEFGRLLLDLARDREAVALFRKLLPVAERVLGDHPVTRAARAVVRDR
ncbi:tetratricopeptide repeat protein [Saccharothrix hoggarensis]|uniref:Tetratricopeptide repeat protein n=1 Tax=Saccharothrix hoggarensis TaxID=913853 RepID=A0ABW3QQZ6_9PSEU